MSDSSYTQSSTQINEEWILIQKAQKDAVHFRPLYEKYFESIFRFIYKRVAEEQLSADLTSTTFLKALKKLNSYTFKGVPFSAWLFRIASNEIAYHFRQQQKNRIVSIEAKNCEDVLEEYEDRSTLDLNLELLKKVIELLKPDEVELIELRFFEKLSFKEIGAVLDITENNAKVKTFRILKKMRKNSE